MTAKAPAAPKTDLWMPLWIGDYLADTMRLPRDLHGGYLLLLFAYWRNRGPLKNDPEDLLSVMKGHEAEWPRLHDKILVPFFTLEDGCWRHKRADAELVIAGLNKAAATAKASRAANARWERERAAAAAAAGENGVNPTPAPPAPATAPNAPSIAPSSAPGIASGTAPSIAGAMLGQCPSPSPSSQNPSGSDSVAKATGAPAAPLQSEISGVPPAPSSTSRQPVAIDRANAPPPVVTATPAPLSPEDLRKRNVWRSGKSLLALDKIPEVQHGTFLGKLSGDYGFEILAEAVESATVNRPAGEITAYLRATCQRLAGERRTVSSKQAQLEAGNDATATGWVAKKKGTQK